jgi:hypothetical protein
MRSVALIPILVVVVTACSSGVRFEGTVELPGVTRPDPKKLHLGISATPGIAAPEPAPGATGIGPILDRGTEAASRKLGYHVLVDGAAAEVQIRFWYDTDGDGTTDPDEPIGALPGPVKGKDEGGCSANRVEIPALTLTAGP